MAQNSGRPDCQKRLHSFFIVDFKVVWQTSCNKMAAIRSVVHAMVLVIGIQHDVLDASGSQIGPPDDASVAASSQQSLLTPASGFPSERSHRVLHLIVLKVVLAAWHLSVHDVHIASSSSARNLRCVRAHSARINLKQIVFGHFIELNLGFALVMAENLRFSHSCRFCFGLLNLSRF